MDGLWFASLTVKMGIPQKSIYCLYYSGMYVPLSDDKHQMVRDSSKKCTGQHRHNSNPVAMVPHAAVVFRMQLFNG